MKRSFEVADLQIECNKIEPMQALKPQIDDCRFLNSLKASINAMLLQMYRWEQNIAKN